MGTMKPKTVMGLLVALGCAGVGVLWWSNSRLAAPNAGTAGLEDAAPSGEGLSTVAAPEARGENAPGRVDGEGMEARGLAEAEASASAGSVDSVEAAGPRTAPGVSWPVKRRVRSTGNGTGAATGDPAVAVELAFRALQYVGVDPEAEKIWLQAINDPRTSAVDRGDLIEDLNEEGYLDNSHPTAEDLPLILARLEMIERLFPYAVDEVNADAFEEAYKDLLNMYIRLGGEPRDKR